MRSRFFCLTEPGVDKNRRRNQEEGQEYSRRRLFTPFYFLLSASCVWRGSGVELRRQKRASAGHFAFRVSRFTSLSRSSAPHDAEDGLV